MRERSSGASAVAKRAQQRGERSRPLHELRRPAPHRTRRQRARCSCADSLNREQGLGFKVFGTVIDKLKLQHLATAMASTIISVAALLALGEETIETASQSASCNMTASQVATAKALFGGSTCNTTIQEILQL